MSRAMILALGLALFGCDDAAGGDDAGIPDAGAPTATEYCNCLLIECHEPFHDTFGVSDAEALSNCGTAAMDAMTAGSFECRANMCVDANDDASACAAALGAPPCD